MPKLAQRRADRADSAQSDTPGHPPVTAFAVNPHLEAIADAAMLAEEELAIQALNAHPPAGVARLFRRTGAGERVALLAEAAPRPPSETPPLNDTRFAETTVIVTPSMAPTSPAGASTPVQEASEEEAAPRRPFFRNPFRQSLTRTRTAFSRVATVFQRSEIDDEMWEELEEQLIGADVGVHTTQRVLTELQGRVRAERLRTPEEALAALREELAAILNEHAESLTIEPPLTVLLVIGVNGVGKTTSIAKLARYLSLEGRRPLLAAADTFRAAAIDQLRVWGERVHVPVIAHQQGADAAATVFDALTAASARGHDVVIVDTAGRLHTKVNLMEELRKISRVASKHGQPVVQKTILVIDATTGQNALTQALTFAKDIGLSGIILTKLDGTAKGGVIFGIVDQLKAPVYFVATGETVEDLAPFDAETFVQALFAS